MAFYYDDNDDWYAITPPDQGVIHFEVTAESVGTADALGLEVQLFNSGGGLIENWNAAVGGASQPATTTLSTVCRGTGTYYVRLYANAPCGVSYKWRYSGTAPVFANDAEDNDNTTQAPTIAYNTSTEGRLAFYYDDNDDWYTITPPDQGVIHFEVTAESVGAADALGLEVQLFNSGGGLLENWNAAVGGASQPMTTTLSTVCRGTGTYYVRLYANAPCGVSYTWRYSGTAPIYPNDVEDNDNTVQATPVPYNANTNGRLAFYYDDNDDWYAIAPADESIIHIEVAAENVGAAVGDGLQVQFFNVGGGLLENWSAAVGGGSTVETTVLNTYCRGGGTYYVRFYANSPCGVSYTWHYTGTDPVFGGDMEPNNNTVEAGPISLANYWQDGRLSFYYGDNDDWYSFSLAADEDVLVNTLAESPGAAGDMQLQLFNSGGGLIGNITVPVGGADVAVAGAADFGVFPAGTYFLRVYANSPCGVSYRLLCHDVDGDGICDGSALTVSEAQPALLSVTAWPNPDADGLFHVTSSFAAISIDVFAMDGRSVEMRTRPGGTDLFLDLSNEPAGIYSLRLRDREGRSATTRLIKP